MILRRITEHVKTQNWFAVALDFLIVVLGVFVATQVSNWNAARVDQVRAISYLERLGNDLASDIAVGERKQIFRSEVAAFGKAGLAYAESGDAAGQSQWDLLLAYFHASQVDEYYLTDATFEELKSAGELGLIRNEAIRDTLSTYYTLGHNVILSERPRYRERVRGIVPIGVQTHIWTNCFSTDVQGAQTIVPCEPPAPDEEIAGIVAKIADNDSLMEDLRYWVSTMEVAAILSSRNVDGARQIKAQIDAELGRAPEKNSGSQKEIIVMQ